MVKTITLRNWKLYNPIIAAAKLSSKLSGINVKCENLSVQDHWNVMENVLINVIDDCAPLFTPNCKKGAKEVVPRNVQHKMNRRKRLIRTDSRNNNSCNINEIWLLNSEIKSYFASIKIGNIRRAACGSSANLWKAVKLAKNLVTNELPTDLTLGGVPVAGGDVANSFAKHFSGKVRLNLSKTNVNVDVVYNGKPKLLVQNRNFMLESDVKKCLYDLSNKKCEGYDRIPVCFLSDSKDVILSPMASLILPN